MTSWLKKNLRQASGRIRRSSPWIKLLTLALGTTCIATMLWELAVTEDKVGLEYKSGGIGCFYATGNVLTELSDGEPASGESIFFHETSCPEDCSDVHLTPRQACSVESALLAHPRKDVFLLITSPVYVPIDNTRNRQVLQLLTYPNFKVRHISFSKYLSNTPLEVIDRTGALHVSAWPVAHASDILRYATLYKFGGIYLDLDVMVFKSMSHLENFAGAESSSHIGSGILGFGSDAVGRKVATDCANELAGTFDGGIWGHNGPGVITRVLQRRCHRKEIANMSKASCRGFDVHPAESFTAIPFMQSSFFFTEDEDGVVQRLLNRSYAIHYWNKFSSSYTLGNRTNVPFVQYAKIYCPKVFKSVNGFF